MAETMVTIGDNDMDPAVREKCGHKQRRGLKSFRLSGGSTLWGKGIWMIG